METISYKSKENSRGNTVNLDIHKVTFFGFKTKLRHTYMVTC